jgi:DNA-directed RNA polymerase specialized sigma subunit
MEYKDYNNDSDAIAAWQKNQDPELLGELLYRFQPAVHYTVAKYKTTGANPAALRAVANTNVIKAISSYQPGHGTVPTTHVFNYLQKVQRGARESLLSGSVPEQRSIKAATYNTVKQSLIDQYRHEPSAHQMADELGWNLKEVARMEKELGGEVGASKSESDFFGHSTAMEHKDRALADYLYQELPPREKLVYEYTFGAGGKPQLNNKEIADKMGTYEMEITRMKRKMGDKIRSYR